MAWLQLICRGLLPIVITSYSRRTPSQKTLKRQISIDNVEGGCYVCRREGENIYHIANILTISVEGNWLLSLSEDIAAIWRMSYICFSNFFKANMTTFQMRTQGGQNPIPPHVYMTCHRQFFPKLSFNMGRNARMTTLFSYYLRTFFLSGYKRVSDTLTLWHSDTLHKAAQFWKCRKNLHFYTTKAIALVSWS